MIRQKCSHIITISLFILLMFASCTNAATDALSFPHVDGELVALHVLQTQHFRIEFYEGGLSSAQSVLQVLMYYVEDIKSLFSIEAMPQTRVRLHASREEFRRWNAWHFDGRPGGVTTGLASRGQIDLLSPNAASRIQHYNLIMGTALHELVHVAQFHIAPSVVSRRYLIEGTAMYLEYKHGFIPWYHLWWFEFERTMRHDFPESGALLLRTNYFGADPYWYGLSMVRFIVREHGWDAVVALHTDSNFYHALGLSAEAFHAAWTHHLRMKYLLPMLAVVAVMGINILARVIFFIFFILKRISKV